jgi:DNA-binding response OmpR family regulator
MSAARVLVVEDDADIGRSLEIILARAGYEVTVAVDGSDGLRRFNEEGHHLVVLDISLPILDGWAVLERIRSVSTTPILLLTARGLEADKVRGLLGGADDYLTKPYSNDELVARVVALLRRSPPADSEPTVYDDGRVRVDFIMQTCEVSGSPVRLTPTEFRLLTTLLRHPDEVLSRQRLLELSWHDPTARGSGRVKFTVLSLRRKLGWGDLGTSPLEAVRGFGYRYRSPRPEEVGPIGPDLPLDIPAEPG